MWCNATLILSIARKFKPVSDLAKNRTLVNLDKINKIWGWKLIKSCDNARLPHQVTS